MGRAWNSGPELVLCTRRHYCVHSGLNFNLRRSPSEHLPWKYAYVILFDKSNDAITNKCDMGVTDSVNKVTWLWSVHMVLYFHERMSPCYMVKWHLQFLSSPCHCPTQATYYLVGFWATPSPCGRHVNMVPYPQRTTLLSTAVFLWLLLGLLVAPAHIWGNGLKSRYACSAKRILFVFS